MASSGSYRKLPEPDDLLKCPYDNAHVIRFKKLPYHLLKCRQNHAVTYESCPFDARHHVPKPELLLHIETCPQRDLVERDIAYALQHNDSSGGDRFRAVTDVPPYDAWEPPEPEEDWGAEISKDGTASSVAWTAPMRDRQSIIACRNNSVDRTFLTDMQQQSMVEPQSAASHAKQGTVQQAVQQQGPRQPFLLGLQQQQPFRPPVGPVPEQLLISPGKQQQQKPWRSDVPQPVKPANLHHPPLQQPSSPLQQLTRPNLSSASAWHQPLLERKLPGSEVAELQQSNVRPLLAGRGRGVRPIPIVGHAGNFVSSDVVARETINQDPGRSRIAANFQHAGIKNENVSASLARELKSSAIEGCDMSEPRQVRHFDAQP